jgi:hypothetical protein
MQNECLSGNGGCNLQAMEMIINYKNGIYRLY